jgi:hypothetical protein
MIRSRISRLLNCCNTPKVENREAKTISAKAMDKPSFLRMIVSGALYIP